MRPLTWTRWARPASFATSVARSSLNHSCPEAKVRAAAWLASPTEMRLRRVNDGRPLTISVSLG